MVARPIENRKVTGKIKESSIQNLCAEKFLAMSGYGYEQTLGDRRREVWFPLESRHRRTEFPKPWVLRPLTAPNRTSETSSLGVSF